MIDLKNNKYNSNTLIENIFTVSLIDILKTQTLSYGFVCNYILNKSYQLTKDEQQINIDYVLKYQTHLQKDILLDTLIFNTNLNTFDFELYSKKYN